MNDPVDPLASPEALDLLSRLYELQGKVTLSGQHNQMWHMSEPSERIERLTGRYPTIWGGEWGFSDERHDTDNVKYRPELIEQIEENHAASRIIVLTYHQASPTVGEPCDFQGGVICKITDKDWDEILEPGAPLHTVWEEHVDRLAEALQSLQSTNIPIIFRPYHEMNGDWFWWGGKPARFLALWDMIYDRFVRHHGLHNLLWAWTTDRPWPGVEAYYPGLQKVDILGADIYPLEGRPEVYPQEWFDRMDALAAGKPLALSEMGLLPTPRELRAQPWSWFMCWDDLVFRSNDDAAIKRAYGDPRVR